MDEYVFPFSEILNNEELLQAIFEDNTDITKKSFDKDLVFQPDIENSKFSNDYDDCKFFITNDCTYYTVDEVCADEIKNCNVSFLQVNCRSLPGNFENFTSFINTLNFHPTVIAVSETWLKLNEEKYYNIDNYNFISVPRPSDNRGGGVGLFILNKFNYILRMDLMSMMPNSCEYLVIELIFPEDKKILITSLYRPPNLDLTIFSRVIPIYCIY